MLIRTRLSTHSLLFMGEKAKFWEIDGGTDAQRERGM